MVVISLLDGSISRKRLHLRERIGSLLYVPAASFADHNLVDRYECCNIASNPPPFVKVP